jgi:hypothetical protein
MENSFDAGAKNVTVEIRGGGGTYIRVTDDGCGMASEDAGVAFLRHATSKLRDEEGLTAIATMGFRGEALAAISAVSHIELNTRRRGASEGTRVLLDGGDITDMLPYDNHLWVVEATGATITELLRMNTSFIPVEDGSFPQVSGVRFTVHTADKTVSNVEVLNKKSGQYEPIDPEKTYTVATIDYCVTGGGFREMLKNCKVIERGEVLYRDVFVQFLEKNLGGRISNDYAQPQGRITIIQ